MRPRWLSLEKSIMHERGLIRYHFCYKHCKFGKLQYGLKGTDEDRLTWNFHSNFELIDSTNLLSFNEIYFLEAVEISVWKSGSLQITEKNIECTLASTFPSYVFGGTSRLWDSVLTWELVPLDFPSGPWDLGSPKDPSDHQQPRCACQRPDISCSKYPLVYMISNYLSFSLGASLLNASQLIQVS